MKDPTQPGTHESFVRGEDIAPGGERPFGIVMAIAIALLSLWGYWYGSQIWFWLAGIAVAFLATAYLWPSALQPLNRAWFKFGMILHAVVNPVVMGVIFFVAVLPTGVVMRALGNDLLRLRFEPNSDSYWIVRRPLGPEPETMKDQF